MSIFLQSWIDQEFHLKPEYEHLKILIEQPSFDAREVLQERFPVPKFVQTTEGGSQARFLVTRVNPSRTLTKDEDAHLTGRAESSVVLTEDTSLKVFMQTLVQYAVQS